MSRHEHVWLLAKYSGGGLAQKPGGGVTILTPTSVFVCECGDRKVIEHDDAK